jgi:hypothetical protein
MALFPHRLKGIQILEGKELSPLLTDDFLLLPEPKKLQKGKTYTVKFRAERP